MSAESRTHLTFRGYRAGDEISILELFRRSFFHERSLEHWQWKFQRNPWGREKIVLAFDGDAKLVAQYAGYPVPFRRAGADLLAHQIGDTMTDTSVRYGGRGPSSTLARSAFAFYDAFCRAQVAFNYGFNVGNIQKFSTRFLESACVEPVTYRTIDVRSHPVVPIRRWERIVRGYRLELVTRPGDEYDELFARVERDYGILVRRDREYLQWRYFDSPELYHFIAIRKFTVLVGWIVFRIRGDRFTIGDALFDRRFGDAPEVLLRHVVPSHPVALVEGWFPVHPEWFSSILSDLGFQMSAEPDNLALMCTPFLMTDAGEQLKRLYYTWGDSDLF